MLVKIMHTEPVQLCLRGQIRTKSVDFARKHLEHRCRRHSVKIERKIKLNQDISESTWRAPAPVPGATFQGTDCSVEMQCGRGRHYRRIGRKYLARCNWRDHVIRHVTAIGENSRDTFVITFPGAIKQERAEEQVAVNFLNVANCWNISPEFEDFSSAIATWRANLIETEQREPRPKARIGLEADTPNFSAQRCWHGIDQWYSRFVFLIRKGWTQGVRCAEQLSAVISIGGTLEPEKDPLGRLEMNPDGFPQCGSKYW